MSPLLKIFLLCCLAGCQACTTVQPWERGNLAKKEMSMTAYPTLHKFRDHIFGAREASQGGHSSAGGGCGCN